MDEQCASCDAKCCRYFCLQIDTPEDYDEYENIRWYLCHEGVTVHVDEGDWYLSISNPCRKLRGDGRCEIYEDRPLICRSYSPDGCDASGGDYDYDELFETPEAFDEYVRRTMGKVAYNMARKKQRAKLDAPKGKAKGKGEQKGKANHRAKAKTGHPGKGRPTGASSRRNRKK
jgi:Fe-S-cluster containining protein